MFCVDAIDLKKNRFFFIKDVNPQAKRPVAILLHGFPDDAFGMNDIIQDLKTDYNIIAPFLPGAGVQSFHFSFEDYVEAISLILKKYQMQGRDVLLIGHDIGCFYNHELACSSELNIKKVVHFNGLGMKQYTKRFFNSAQFFRSSYVLLAQFSFIRRFMISFLSKQFFRIVYTLSGVKKDSSLHSNKKDILEASHLYTYLFKKAILSLFQNQKKNSIPTLFLWGKEDRFLNIPNRFEVDSVYHNAEIRILDGGHWIIDSHKDQVIRVLNKFISSFQTKANYERI